jgi:acyl carrier protein
MNLDNIVTDLAYLLEIDKSLLTLNTELESFSNWDSLAVVSMIAMIDQEFKVIMDWREITSCKTLQEIFILANQKIKCAA